MIRSACGTGSGRRRTERTMLKIAVFAPMHRPSVSSAVSVKVRSLKRRRKGTGIELTCPHDTAAETDWSALVHGAPGLELLGLGGVSSLVSKYRMSWVS